MSKASRIPQIGTERHGRTAPLAQCMAPALAAAGYKHGFTVSRILTEWAMIVGPELAGRTMPERIRRSRTGATLRLRTTPAFAVEVQHMLPLIRERIATYIGEDAISRIELKQGPVISRTRPPLPRPRRLPPEEEAALSARAAAVVDADVAAALLRLGRAVKGSR